MRLATGKTLTRRLEGLAAKTPRPGRGLAMTGGPRGAVMTGQRVFRLGKEPPMDADEETEEMYDEANQVRPLERGTPTINHGPLRKRWGRGLHVVSKLTGRQMRDAAQTATLRTAAGGIQAGGRGTVVNTGTGSVSATASPTGSPAVGAPRQRDGLAGALRGFGEGGARAGSGVSSRQHANGLTFDAVEVARVTLNAALLSDDSGEPPVDFPNPPEGTSITVAGGGGSWDFSGHLAIRPAFQDHFATLLTTSGHPAEVVAEAALYKNAELQQELTGTLRPRGVSDWQIIIPRITLPDLTPTDTITLEITALYWQL